MKPCPTFTALCAIASALNSILDENPAIDAACVASGNLMNAQLPDIFLQADETLSECVGRFLIDRFSFR